MAKKPKFPLPDFSQTGFAKTGGAADFWASNPLPNFGTTTAAPPSLPDPNPTASDPTLLAALASLTAQGVYDKSSRNAALQSAYIRFGDAPIDPRFLPADLRGEVGQILDPQTRALAKQNDTAGLSILARLKDAAQQTQKRTVDVLGSRGLFRSGETGYQLKRGQLGSSQASFDATNKFMDYIMGVQAAYVQSERARLAAEAAARGEAAGRVVPPTEPPPHSNPNPHPYGPGVEPDGSSFPPPPQPTGGPWMPPIDPILDLLKTYRPKGLGGLETQPQ